MKKKPRRRKRCAGCGRLFGENLYPSHLRYAKFCSALCYHVDSRKVPPRMEPIRQRERIRIAAMAVHHEKNLQYYARELNSRKIPQTEKEYLLGMARWESELAQKQVVDGLKLIPKHTLKWARETLAKTPGLKPPKGAFFCKECGMKQVQRPFSTCNTCKSKKHKVQIPEEQEPKEGPKEVPDIDERDLRRFYRERNPPEEAI